jgi:diguanylate cyclase (GGDEF)-like protein
LYATGWIVFFLGVLTEIGAIAGVIPVEMKGIFNTQVSVVTSALFIACSLAERMNVDKRNRLAAEARERIALEKFRRTYEGAPIGLCAFDFCGKVSSANPYCLELFSSLGFDLTSADGNAIFGIHKFSTLKKSTEIDSDLVSDPVEFEIAGTSGEKRWVAARMKRSVVGYESTIADISSRKYAEARADWLVDHDNVTSLLNRRGFYKRLENSIAALGGIRKAYLLAIKIENFRQYTTYFGEQFASELARTVAERITHSGLTFDGVGRTGENVFFAVLVNETQSELEENVDVLSKALNGAIYSVEDRELVVSLAFAAVELDQSQELKSNVAACEIAVAMPAKKQLSNEKIYAKGDLKLAKIMQELELISQFRFEFPANRLFLLAQPIVSSHLCDCSMSYEILVRMKSMDGSVITPDRFIPSLEKSGLMSRLDEWVISTTFSWLVNNPSHLSSLSYVSINLSGASLNDVKFLNTVLELAAKYPEAVRKTCFEITEGVALANFDSTVRFIDTLGSLGAKVALDDFGAGYTSFGYLAEIKADFVKIDGSLIKGLKAGSNRYEIVKGIVAIAHSLGIQVVAEWVEDAKTICLLQEIGVNSLQGWALSKPLTLDEVSSARNGLDFINAKEIEHILLPKQTNLAFNL